MVFYTELPYLRASARPIRTVGKLSLGSSFWWAPSDIDHGPWHLGIASGDYPQCILQNESGYKIF